MSAGITVAELRGWLLQQPKPRMVRIHSDGDVQELTIRPGQSYAKIAETIHALAGDLLEAMDEDGGLIRAMRPQEPTQVNAPEMPALPTNADSETQRLHHFTALLAHAYRFATEISFGKMVSLFERLDNRSIALETRLERTERAYYRTLQQQVDDAMDDAETLQEQAAEAAAAAAGGDEDAFKKMLVEAFMNGKAQGAAGRGRGGGPPPTNNGHGSNGKG